MCWGNPGGREAVPRSCRTPTKEGICVTLFSSFFFWGGKNQNFETSGIAIFLHLSGLCFWFSATKPAAALVGFFWLTCLLALSVEKQISMMGLYGVASNRSA